MGKYYRLSILRTRALHPFPKLSELLNILGLVKIILI
jgi:hypothetical protein